MQKYLFNAPFVTEQTGGLQIIIRQFDVADTFTHIEQFKSEPIISQQLFETQTCVKIIVD